MVEIHWVPAPYWPQWQRGSRRICKRSHRLEIKKVKAWRGEGGRYPTNRRKGSVGERIAIRKDNIDDQKRNEGMGEEES